MLIRTWEVPRWFKRAKLWLKTNFLTSYKALMRKWTRRQLPQWRLYMCQLLSLSKSSLLITLSVCLKQTVQTLLLLGKSDQWVRTKVVFHRRRTIKDPKFHRLIPLPTTCIPSSPRWQISPNSCLKLSRRHRVIRIKEARLQSTSTSLNRSSSKKMRRNISKIFSDKKWSWPVGSPYSSA